MTEYLTVGLIWSAIYNFYTYRRFIWEVNNDTGDEKIERVKNDISQYPVFLFVLTVLCVFICDFTKHRFIWPWFLIKSIRNVLSNNNHNKIN